MMRGLSRTLFLAGVAAAVTYVLRTLDAQGKAVARPQVETWENEGGALRSGSVADARLSRST